MIILNAAILDINSFVSIPIEAGESRSIIKRASSGLVFSPNGISHYHQDDKVYVSDNTHVLYLPEGATYSIKCEKGDICPLINFKCNSNVSEIISFPVDNSQLLLDKFKALEQTWIFENEKKLYTGMIYLYEVLAVLTSENVHYPTEVPKIMKNALAYMHANYANPCLTNDIIAKDMNISTVYFRKLFKKYYSKSPIKYIIDIRLQQARQLLKAQTLSVQEIAFAVGFSSLYHFSRAFKNATGLSPSQYKNMYRSI